jgi:hypothetical protein
MWHVENREGWPLLAVETEVNGDSKSTNERGPSLAGGLLGLSCRYIILPRLLWSAQYEIVFSHRMAYTISIYVSLPIAQQPGQAVMQGRLSLYVCLW